MSRARTRDSSEPSRPAPWTSQWEPSAAELWEALQSTVASQGSCFPVLSSLPVSLSLSGMRTIAFLRGESFLLPSPPAVVSKDPDCSQCPMLQVPNAGHHRAPALGQLVPGSRVHCCCCRWHFLLPDPTPPEFSDRAQDCGVRPSSRQCPLQSLRPSAALASQCPHWCRSFLYCKETYLRLLIAVWFGVFLQTPFVLWGP